MDKELAVMTSCLTELHEWEVAKLPVIDSTTGRLLYFRIAKQRLLGLDQEHDHQHKSLKDIYGDSQLSEKALRLRLREFEDVGLIRTQVSTDDARVRCLEPTAQFDCILEYHMNKVKKIFSDHFFLIEK